MEFPHWTHTSKDTCSESVLHLSKVEQITVTDESRVANRNMVSLTWTTARRGKDSGHYTRVYHIYEPTPRFDISDISPNGRVLRPDEGVRFEKVADVPIKQETVRKHLSVMFSKLSKHAKLHPNAAQLTSALEFIKKHGIFKKIN